LLSGVTAVIFYPGHSMNDARLAVNRIEHAWLLSKFRKYAKMQFESIRVCSRAMILQSSYRQHLSRIMLLHQKRLQAKALQDFKILVRDLGGSSDSYTSNRRFLAEKLMQVITLSRIESSSFRSHQGVVELKRSTGVTIVV
jgi:hypothetical protein